MARLSLFVLLLVCLSSGPSSGGTIHGMVYAAAHEDSLVRGAPIGLLIGEGTDPSQRMLGQTDASGHFHFHDVSTDPGVEYRLMVERRGREFVSEAMQFLEDQDEIEFNLLLTSGESQSAEMPAGHPPTGGEPQLGQPVDQNPVHTALIVLWIVLLFAGFWLWARRSREPSGSGKPSPKARSLIRDIASLDNRHEDGIVGEEEYRKIRSSLLEQVRSLMGGSTGS